MIERRSATTVLPYESPPEPRIVGTTTVPCETCGRMGYHEDSSKCGDCGGSGGLLVEIVACPVHGATVTRSTTDGLLGVCDGCAAETARALSVLSNHSTRVGGPVLGESAADARRESL